jgi:hypothetical protein
MQIPVTFLSLLMIHTSRVVVLLRLPYYGGTLVPGAQTIRPGWAGPVSVLLGGEGLTGCFLLQAVPMTTQFVC